jgi:hypothetical protein
VFEPQWPVLGVWSVEEEAAGLRRLDPAIADAVVARLVAERVPDGCYAVVGPGSTPMLCPFPPVAGRAFCTRHAALGWCERPRPVRPRPPARRTASPPRARPLVPPTPARPVSAPPKPMPPAGWPYRQVPWREVVAAHGGTTALPPPIDRHAEEYARRDAVRAALDRAHDGKPVAVWTSVSPVWDWVGLAIVGMLPRSDNDYS